MRNLKNTGIIHITDTAEQEAALHARHEFAELWNVAHPATPTPVFDLERAIRALRKRTLQHLGQTGKYWNHPGNGAREMARRVRQQQKAQELYGASR